MFQSTTDYIYDGGPVRLHDLVTSQQSQLLSTDVHTMLKLLTMHFLEHITLGDA
jgi:hypothetical protein